MKECYLCQSTKLRQPFSLGGYPLWHCDSCGYEWLWPQPDDQAMAEIYSKPYYEDRLAHIPEARPREMKYKNFEELLKQIKLAAHSTVLDIGCAEGDLLNILKDNGHDVYGIDYSSYAASLCRDLFGPERIHNGELKDKPFPEIKFDAIFMMDVLEHVRDPREVVKEIKERLKPGGQLILLLPDLGSLSQKILGKTWPHYLAEHLHYFDKRTISKLLQEQGFDIVALPSIKKILTIRHIARTMQRRPGKLQILVWSLVQKILNILPGELDKKFIYIPCGQFMAVAKTK